MASDDFTNTNGTALATHDSNWLTINATYPVGNFEIQSNQLQSTAAWQSAGAYYSGSQEDYSEITLIGNSGITTNGNKSPAVRMGTGVIGYSMQFANYAAGSWADVYLLKDGNWVATLSTGGSWAVADNHTVLITASGTTTTTLEVFIGGVSQGTYNDTTTPHTTGYDGILLLDNYGDVAYSQFNDWTNGVSAGGASGLGFGNPLTGGMNDLTGGLNG